MADLHREQSWRCYVRCQRQWLTPALAAVLADPEAALEAPGARLLQDNFKSTIALMEVDHRPLVLKKHKYKSLRHRIKRLFFPTRAAKNWRYAMILRRAGILTPAPVAMVETRIGPLRGMSYYICEYIDGVGGEEFFQRHARDRVRIDRAFDELLALTAKIRSLGLIHGDIRQDNLVFNQAGMWLLDLDDMKEIAWYHGRRARSRDYRGLESDVWYHVPPIHQIRLLNRLHRAAAEAGLGWETP